MCVCVCVSGIHVTWLAFAFTLQGTKHLDMFVYQVNIEEKRQNKAANITLMSLITVSNRPWASNNKPDMSTRSGNNDYKEKTLKQWQITHHSKQGPCVGNLIAMTWYRQACDSSNLEICGENKPGVTSVWIHLQGLGERSVLWTKLTIAKAQGVRPLRGNSVKWALPWKSAGVCWKQLLHQLCPQRSVPSRFQIHWTKRTLFTRINLQIQRWVVNTIGFGSTNVLKANTLMAAYFTSDLFKLLHCFNFLYVFSQGLQIMIEEIGIWGYLKSIILFYFIIFVCFSISILRSMVAQLEIKKKKI